MNSPLIFFLFCFFFASVNVQGARILIVYHIPSTSHHILGEAFARGLSDRGHKVTMYSPYPLKTQYKNCKHVLIDGVFEKMEKFNDMMQANQRFLAEFTQFTDIIETMTEASFQSKALKELIQSKQKFDLVILDYFFNDAHFGLAHHFNASLIVSSSSISHLVNHLTGNPAPFSFVPSLISRSTDQMNFWERFSNTFSGILGMMMHNYLLIPTQEMLYKKYFNNGPQLEELMTKVDLVFVNTHPVLETPRPYMPNMKQIGGFHIEEPKPLSKDLQEFIESAKDGVIFCSLGSNVKSSDLPQEKVNAFIKTFSKLKQKIIWKWENDKLTNKPDNVLIGKWFSQRDILAHPNVKIFITHGGLLSFTEAMFSGVPLVVIPFFGDQPSNAANIAASGYGIQVLPEEINEDTLTDAIQEILTNKIYRDEMHRRSSIINDQPQKPLASAIYWMEHILRHGGGRHLQSTASRINIFQYLLLDIAAVALVSIATIGALVRGLYLSIKFCYLRNKVNKKGDTKKSR